MDNKQIVEELEKTIRILTNHYNLSHTCPTISGLKRCISALEGRGEGEAVAWISHVTLRTLAEGKPVTAHPKETPWLAQPLYARPLEKSPAATELIDLSNMIAEGNSPNKKWDVRHVPGIRAAAQHLRATTPKVTV